MTKRRFIKLLMSIGYSRNNATRYAQFRYDIPYSEDWKLESHALNNAKNHKK